MGMLFMPAKGNSSNQIRKVIKNRLEQDTRFLALHWCEVSLRERKRERKKQEEEEEKEGRRGGSNGEAQYQKYCAFEDKELFKCMIRSDPSLAV